MTNTKLTPIKDNLKLENINSGSDFNFKNHVSTFINTMTQFVQVSVNYGINSKFFFPINNQIRVQFRFYCKNDYFGENFVHA